MRRYIDAYALENRVEDFEKLTGMKLDIVHDFVSSQPTVDVVEVVRCKDCKHSSPNKVYGCRLEPFNTLENGERMYSDDYCSYGKKRDD